jgi:hypothetical protein
LILILSWIACGKYVNVVDILNEKYAISSLLMLGVPTIALGWPSEPLLFGWSSGNVAEFWSVSGGSIVVLAALAVRRLRRRQIDPLGVKLIELLSTLSQQRAPSRLRSIAPQWPLLGVVLITTVMSVVLSPFNPVFGELTAVFALGILVPLTLSVFQPNANTVLKADSRRPVLLMRSFIDDERMSELLGIRRLFIYFEWLFEGFNWRSLIDDTITEMKPAPLESRLANHFARYGPFIAVGSQSWGMPVTGAARIKLTDLEWRDQVVRWIDDSVIILMMAGVTDWVEWELKQVIAHNALGKLSSAFHRSKGVSGGTGRYKISPPTWRNDWTGSGECSRRRVGARRFSDWTMPNRFEASFSATTDG